MEISRSLLSGDFGTVRDVDLNALLLETVYLLRFLGVVSPVLILQK